jgi:serine/threonine-protein kinase
VSPEKRVAVPPVNARSIAVSETSMAVLPFKPLLPENRDQVLEMGMADTLITKLGNSGGMIVPSLTSVRKYGDLDQDPLAAGRKLGVNSVLEGTVQKSGDRLRVTVRLIKVADGSSLWAGTFDEKFTDVFTVEDTISQKVAEVLALRLSGEEQNRLTKRYTENTAAYQLYLMGRYHLFKLTPPDITKSIGFFQQAIEADPGYALAYFGLAEAYRSSSITGDKPPKEAFPLAKAAATKAVQIDESLAEPHASLAFTHMWFDWDWGGAEREARRAIALNPNSAWAHYAYAHVLSDLGRHQEAIAEGARARKFDPVSLLLNAREGAVLYYAGHNDEARERLQKTVELDPNFWIAHLYLGHVYLEKKNYPEAIAEFSKARECSRGNSEAISMTGYAWALAGDAAKARATLDELESRSAHQYVPRYNIAVLHLALAERDEAFAWLEKAYEEHDVLVSFLKIDPKWDSMRSDPRFAAILKRVGLQ